MLQLQETTMRRHAQLQPLSRSHHQTLRLARQLKLGQWNLADLRAEKKELYHHFTEEESTFSSLVFGLADTHPIMAQLSRMIFEHIAIMALISCIEHSKPLDNSEQVIALGELLSEHIAFEERELFPTLEQCCLINSTPYELM
ncbi:hemerythrin domain-containing protein [Halothiobacillus sp.]|uniref:hemerythrin domain-containing protein n=1 Tax=Halothiobacillus sp. TaxID=1891311 RepID=UPI0026331D76|nr:hemerythrin domain-containing protein [Halothiobacillus sp.]MDY0147215.1 hemerythrin domain-containing protein [Halothiobacillus sp.]